MATTVESLDLLGTETRHRRPRPRTWSPPVPPPRAAERLPAAPATAEMEAPVWPVMEAAPPVRAAATWPPPSVPPVPPRLAAASVVPRTLEVREVRELRTATVRAPQVRAPEVRVPERPSEVDLPGDLLDDDTMEAWFDQDPSSDDWQERRPVGMPWWALAVPASAALGIVSMVVTVLALAAAWT